MDIILKNRGNYKELLTFKKATVIFDLTYHFCTRYLKQGDRTIDQMIQAARSGTQNIAEGVAASSTAAETEIRNFARQHEDSRPYLEIAEKRNDEVVANMAILLLKQEDYLLYRQLEAIEREFKEKGDLKGRMKPAAKAALAKNRDAAMKAAKEWGKKCPKCGKAMDDGTTSSNGVLQPKWRCPKCGNVVEAAPGEISEALHAWYNRVWELKWIYGY